MCKSVEIVLIRQLLILFWLRNWCPEIPEYDYKSTNVGTTVGRKIVQRNAWLNDDS